MKPALPSLLMRATFSGDSERLVPAVRERDQILLERDHTKDIDDLVVVELRIRTFGTNDELSFATRESRGDTASRQLGASEMAEHRLGGRLLQREIVMRFSMTTTLFDVALGASVATDIRRRRERSNKRVARRAIKAPLADIFLARE